LADEPDRPSKRSSPSFAGCTCVLKPSEESAPINAMIFAEFCHDAGFAPGRVR
jgi:acyl-CoA reductase-like NAD-dependent aldehyde dehydrogenase